MKTLNRKKQFVIFLGVLFLAVCMIAGYMLISGEKKSGKEDSMANANALPVKTMKASYVYDVSDKKVAVGAVDYVFAGKVLSYDEVVYEDLVPMEDEDGNTIEVGSPYTHYTVQVLENMKGELITEEPIKIVKDGGIGQDGEAVYLYEDDSLPQVGKAYIFLAYTQEDGSLLISGMDSNILLETTEKVSTRTIEHTGAYEEYKEAIKHQIIPKDYQRDTSIYDAKGNK